MSENQVVQWRAGFRLSQRGSVEDVDAVLWKIRNANKGELPKEAVVEAARSKNNVCHPFFTWDDTQAANERRLEQAGDLIRAVWVVRLDTPDLGSRKYEIDRSAYEPKKKIYKHIDDILNDPIARKELLTRALTDLNSARRRYKKLKELAAVFKELDKVMVR